MTKVKATVVLVLLGRAIFNKSGYTLPPYPVKLLTVSYCVFRFSICAAVMEVFRSLLFQQNRFKYVYERNTEPLARGVYTCSGVPE